MLKLNVLRRFYGEKINKIYMWVSSPIQLRKYALTSDLLSTSYNLHQPIFKRFLDK